MVNSDIADSNIQLLRDRWLQRRGSTTRTTADFLLYLCEHQSTCPPVYCIPRYLLKLRSAVPSCAPAQRLILTWHYYIFLHIMSPIGVNMCRDFFPVLFNVGFFFCVSRSPGPRAQRTDGVGPSQQPDNVDVGKTGKNRKCSRVPCGGSTGARRMLDSGIVHVMATAASGPNFRVSSRESPARLVPCDRNTSYTH